MEGITIEPHLLWDFIITIIVIPAGFLVRSLLAEQKRLDILVNKTREELAKEYVTRDQLEKDLEKLIQTMERIDEKLDRLQTKNLFPRLIFNINSCISYTIIPNRQQKQNLKITSKENLAPVLEINVDDDQLDDRVDEALQYFYQYHYEGSTKVYLKHQMTSDQLTTMKTNETTTESASGTHAYNDQH